MIAEIIEILDAEMAEPGLYGWFHNLWLIITTAATILLCKLFGKGTPKQVCAVVLTVALAVTLLEVYKQINYTFTVDDQGNIEADYEWYAFPFQFCSTPMYVGLLAGIIRKGRIHRALCAYLATYAVFAGAAVMAYPADVFIKTIGINIQTMVCHGSMITVGVYLLYTGYVKVEHKTILRAMPVFAAAVVLAAVMNEIAHMTGLLETDTFNMFFISPYCESTLPVYGPVHEAVPFPLNLIIYILGFTAAAYVILLLAMGVKKIGQKSNKQAIAA
ncbi:MAG: YwaF family protein [Oscillospiraceae bacterium]|nr:YwaF family protein [Oscillospiraceae bacterium]